MFYELCCIDLANSQLKNGHMHRFVDCWLLVVDSLFCFFFWPSFTMLLRMFVYWPGVREKLNTPTSFEFAPDTQLML